MTPLELLAVFVAGLGAGTINAVVGSGTLITFPTLLALGVPPVTANMSNSLGLVPGSIAGAYGYRGELVGQRRRILHLLAFSTAGGALGALLLLVLPPGAFEAVVPGLILLGVLLVVVQPRLSRAVAARAARRADHAGATSTTTATLSTTATRSTMAWWVPAGAFATGVYGGYFGAAQGVLLMGLLGIGVAEGMQRLNGIKNVLVAVVNAVAGLIFVVAATLSGSDRAARVDWTIVLVIGLGAVLGGFLGAAVGRRLPPIVLRTVIVIVGISAAAVIVLT